MKQTFTSARRPLEILIHLSAGGLCSVSRSFRRTWERKHQLVGLRTPCRRTTFFYDRVLRQLFPVGSPLPFSESG